MSRSVPLRLVANGFLALTLSTASPVLADRPLRLSFGENELLVEDLDAGEVVIVTTIARFSRGSVPHNERQDHWLADEDEDGVVSVALVGPVPPKFVAIAVALATGRFDVLTPEGSPAREVALPAHTLQEGPGNRLEKLQDDRRYVELLWVRPGLGAWTLGVLDGSREDESPASDGRVLTSPLVMSPLGESPPPPDAYERDDLIFRVAPREAEYYAARIVR